MFVGVGASRVRDMFEQGKKHSPCIIFIDEIDAVGRSRGAGLGGGNDEREQTLNQLLVEMDGFDTNEGVIIIAATNRPDVLDPALLRPGRFDRQVVVSNPDLIGREKILKVHAKKISMAPDVNLRTVARGTPGFSGADLANLVNEAALLAARKNKRIVTYQEFEEAKDKVMMGSERRSMVMSEEEKKLTAYHEAGHAIVTINEKAAYPIHKATIIPRGRALGMVMQLPERDEVSQTREQLHAQMAIAMGGRVAEEIIFGDDKVTTGAASDIEQATKRARAMVMRAGLSKEMGPVAYGENEEEVFLGRSVARQQNMSEETARKVDSEIRKFVDMGYERARKVLTEKIDDLHKLAKALLTYETLSGEEIENLINKNVYPKDKEDIKVEDTKLTHEELENRQNRLIRERDEMGPVNLRAEIEMKELEQQISNILLESEDLQNAIDKLRLSIKTLNREGKERILVSFEKVQVQFQKIFKQLFSGGEAKLEFTDPSDPLNSGLEIMAKPPGKKLQTLSLLSGGEKALTAISLLFAVFLTNPSPLCVLDEVDAPLDDTNVARFCDLLDEIKDATNTRFMIITHHRLTMARMDRLYGVTMSENGVSQLVSVNLEKAIKLKETA